MLRREAENTVIVGLCVAALVVLLGTSGTAGLRVGVVLWVLGQGVIIYRCRRIRGARQLGVHLIGRTLLVVAPGAVLLHRSIDTAWPAWLAIALLVLSIRNEPLVKRAAGFTGIRVSGMEQIPTRSENTRLSKTYGWSVLVAPVVLMVLALLRVSGWVWLLVVLVCGALSAAVMLDAVKRRRMAGEAKARIPELLEELAPAFVLYWDAPRNSQYQIGMWIPHLEQTGLPFFVMVRNGASFRQAVSVAGDVPVVECRTMADVERCRPSSLRAAFYVNNAARNSHFIRYAELTHVQLLHGDSDKAPSFSPVTAMFDKVFVAGQAGIDRYAAHDVLIAPEKFEIVGRPQVVGIEQPRSTHLEPEHTTALYAPTWRGYHEDASYSSMGYAIEIVQELLDIGATVIFRPHPYCSRDAEFRAIMATVRGMLERDAEATGRAHRYGADAEKADLKDCFNASDLMVADISGVVPDYLYSTKPFILVDRAGDKDAFVQEFPLAAAAYVIDGTHVELQAALQEVFGRDPMAAVRRSRRTHYLGDFPADTYQDAFLNAVQAVVGPEYRIEHPAPAGGGEPVAEKVEGDASRLSGIS